MDADEAIKAVVSIAILAAVVIVVAYLSLLFIPLGIVGAAWFAYHWYSELPSTRAARARQKADQLYRSLCELRQRNFPEAKEFNDIAYNKLNDLMGHRLPIIELGGAYFQIATALYAAERSGLDIEALPQSATTIEVARYCDAVAAVIRKFSASDIPNTVASTVAEVMRNFCETLPPGALHSEADLAEAAANENRTPKFSGSLMEMLSSAGRSVHEFILPFYDERLIASGLFKDLRQQFDRNQSQMSQLPYTPENYQSPKLISPPDHDGTAHEIVRGYLNATPFLKLFDTRLPISIPAKLRFEGTWVVAPRGRGKTTLLSSLLEDDLNEVADGRASIIVMDSKGDIIDHLKRLHRFAPGQPLADKIVLIEPWDHLALNPLDIGGSPDSAIRNMLYLFGGILDTKTTPLQETLLAYLLIACKAIPGATVSTMQHILSEGWKPYEKHIAELPQSQRDFFLKEFDSETYKKTRTELQWRLRKLLMEAPMLEQMFSAPSTKLNIGAAMDAGKVIVINNSTEKLTREGSEFFARYFVALVLAAAQRRARLRDDEKIPVYFYIDECQTVISRDEKIAVILNECRSQKIAMTFAHQAMQQITSDNVKTALADCGIRIANSDEEASILAPRLRCSPDFLRELQRGQFALFMRDQTKHPMVLSAPNNPIWKWQKMADPEFQEIEAAQKTQWCYTPPPRQSAPVSPEPQPTDPPPKKWKRNKAA